MQQHELAQTDAPTASPVGLGGVKAVISEKGAWRVNGFIVVLLAVLLGVGAVAAFINALVQFEDYNNDSTGALLMVVFAILILLTAVLSTMVTIVQPGETRVVTFFGNYVGTIRQAGVHATVPFSVKKKVSVRVNNFETNEIKVNDADGNPVNIAAIVVWQVDDTAKSAFAVENYNEFVHVQSEAALRHVASSYPYDNAGPGQPTLRGSTELISDELANEVAARIALAGLTVVECRISNLAYAPEIAQAMLQRQQAAAVVAAREQIVEGAVGMVRRALDRLESDGVVDLDEERKATMVSNLLVVLSSESRATPVINAGSLYN